MNTEKRHPVNPVKIIFFDIDGTLVDPSTGKISAKTCEALCRLHENCILLCIATGRPPASLPDLTELPFDGFLTCNGALCYTKTEILHSDPLSPNDVKQILKNAAEIGRPVSVAVRDRLAANGIDEDLAGYYRLAGLNLTVADDFELVCREDVYQIMLGCREPDYASVIRGTESVKLAVSWDRAADAIPASSGKGAALGKILAHFHLDASQALAFGDSYNDMEMLQAVGTGVAMGNAPAVLKSIADDVCGHVSEDGIYHYCINHGLI